MRNTKICYGILFLGARGGGGGGRTDSFLLTESNIVISAGKLCNNYEGVGDQTGYLLHLSKQLSQKHDYRMWRDVLTSAHPADGLKGCL
jgi:hypothetical protein